MYLEKLQLDRKFGFGSENSNIEILRTFLGCPDLKQNSQFDLFDYESDEYLIELKTRRCKSNTYSDTMIPKNKIDFCKTANKTIYFFFQFVDGLYYWKYDKLTNLRLDNGGRSDRGHDEIKKYYYIPCNYLIKPF